VIADVGNAFLVIPVRPFDGDEPVALVETSSSRVALERPEVQARRTKRLGDGDQL
jgi:hypothetical protein